MKPRPPFTAAGALLLALLDEVPTIDTVWRAGESPQQTAARQERAEQIAAALREYTQQAEESQ